MLLSEAFDLYREEYMDFKVKAVRILETHEQVRRSLIKELGDKPVDELTLHDLNVWMKSVSEGRSQNTIRIYLTRIRMVMDHLEKRDLPCLKATLIPVPKRIDNVAEFLEPSEVARMIDATPRLRNKFIISLLYSSGIRLSELISLNRGQIRGGKFSVVGKGGKARLCFIDERTEELMELYLSSRDDCCEALVISYRSVERMTKTNIEFLVKNTAKRAGISRTVTPHTLRHSFATNFLENNGNLRYCQVLMGHARIETTAQYAHVTNKMLELQYSQFHTTS